MKRAVVVILNGWDTKNVDHLDIYSEKNIQTGVEIFRKCIARGEDAKLVFTKAEMANINGKFQNNAGMEMAESLGVPQSRMELTTLPNRNAISDVLSAAEYCSRNFDRTDILFFAPEVSMYFRIICWAIKWWYGLTDWRYSWHVAKGTPPAKTKWRQALPFWLLIIGFFRKIFLKIKIIYLVNS